MFDEIFKNMFGNEMFNELTKAFEKEFNEKDEKKDYAKNDDVKDENYYYSVTDKYENGKQVFHKEKEVKNGEVLKDNVIDKTCDRTFPKSKKCCCHSDEDSVCKCKCETDNDNTDVIQVLEKLIIESEERNHRVAELENELSKAIKVQEQLEFANKTIAELRKQNEKLVNQINAIGNIIR